MIDEDPETLVVGENNAWTDLEMEAGTNDVFVSKAVTIENEVYWKGTKNYHSIDNRNRYI